MSNVKLLDNVTINQIAAGEVVERPASCVKELIENALDAGATRIEIEILDGGKELIRITDNGVGMTKGNAALAIRRHATSKLSSVDDLQNMLTLGFRGEALPSIAAVSKFTLMTRTADSELGTKIKVEGGLTLGAWDVGCKIGTTVLVEKLFFNVPARLKFLKATPTEGSRIHDFVVKLALSRPDIAFVMINGGRNVLTTPGNGKLLDALAAVYGAELANSLLEVKLSSETFNIIGYAGKPNLLHSYRNRQTFIVNGRVITHKTIYKAVDEAYKSLVTKNGYPLVVLKIDVPPNYIDVNAHPQKIEIKFQDDGELYKNVYSAVRNAVEEKRSISDLRKIAAPVDKPRYEQLNLDEYFNGGNNPSASGKKSEFIIDPKSDNPALTIEQLREKAGKNDDADNFDKGFFDDDDFFKDDSPKDDDIEPKDDLTPKTDDAKNLPAAESSTAQNVTTTPLENFRPIGQVDLCYIVAQSDSDLYLIDQHAAHERILFDRLSAYKDRIPAQILLIQENLKFDSREAMTIENNLELFAELGFSMEPSGENEFRLLSTPADASKTDAGAMLREIISSLPESDSKADIDAVRRSEIAANIRRNFIAIASCRGAIKAGKKLSTEEMELLLNELSRTPNPYTCPHGRPTIIKFSSSDLAKMFHRS